MLDVGLVESKLKSLRKQLYDEGCIVSDSSIELVRMYLLGTITAQEVYRRIKTAGQDQE